MSDDRIERALEALQFATTAMQADIAVIKASLAATAPLARQLADHEKHDAEIQASLRADMKRIWWLVSAAVTAAAGALAKAFGVSA